MPQPIAATPSAPPTPQTLPSRPAPAADATFGDALANAQQRTTSTPPPTPQTATSTAPTTPQAAPPPQQAATAARSGTDLTLGQMLSLLSRSPAGRGAATSAAAATAPASTVAGPAASGASTAAVTGSDGARIIATAKRYLGIPYRWGGTDPDTGFDCSGLVQQVFGDLGVTVPRVSADQATVGTEIGSLAEAQPGDLLFWRGSSTNHIGIYVGDGQMLHAPYTGEVVKVGPVRSAPPTTIRRVAV